MENRTMVLSNYLLCKKSNCVKFNLLSFGYASVSSEWKGVVKAPSFSRLYYVISGEAYIEYNNIRLSLCPGNWYLIPSGLSFYFQCNCELEHLFFHITLSGIDEIDLLNQYTTPVFLADNTNPYLDYKDYLEKENLFSALTLKEKIYHIFLKIMEINQIKPELPEYSKCVEKAVEYINNNLSRKLDLASVAKHTYVSKSTLTTKFKEELNLTIQEYIQRQKMFHAGQMLKNSNMSVAQISERLGFSEQFYFSRCFKQIFGLSPREYRNTEHD